MGKPHPVELRERVVGFVKEGHTHRAAAARFRVSVRFVNDMVILKRETGSRANITVSITPCTDIQTFLFTLRPENSRASSAGSSAVFSGTGPGLFEF